MLEKLLTRSLRAQNPGRDVSVVKIGKDYVTLKFDVINCHDYLLEGQYRYAEIVALNKLTGYHCGFGFSKGFGPVAFIGVEDEHSCTTSGYFKYNVHEYGKLDDSSEGYFEVFSDEDAKRVSNYTVYGSKGVEAVATKAPIEKIAYTYDSRFKCKKIDGSNKDKKIIEMDLKLPGTYNFYQSRFLATGSIRDKSWFSINDYPIQFAVVGDNQFVGIINLWDEDCENVLQFRDVWEYGCDEPELQDIRFLSTQEAKNIDNFSLYFYVYPYGIETIMFEGDKQDRTFDRRFEFHLPDGTDYRLI